MGISSLTACAFPRRGLGHLARPSVEQVRCHGGVLTIQRRRRRGWGVRGRDFRSTTTWWGRYQGSALPMAARARRNATASRALSTSQTAAPATNATRDPTAATIPPDRHDRAELIEDGEASSTLSSTIAASDARNSAPLAPAQRVHAAKRVRSWEREQHEHDDGDELGREGATPNGGRLGQGGAEAPSSHAGHHKHAAAVQKACS